jgi:DNA-binding NarL/FixJ family response regulator
MSFGVFWPDLGASEMTKILVVDDHPLYREGLIAALSGHPLRARVVGVSSEDDALSLLDDDPTYELALVDRKLEREDGLDTVRRIGQRHPTVARVVISGEDSAAAVEAAMRAGAQGFLPKSLSIAQMLAAIEHLLHGECYWPDLACQRAALGSGHPRAPHSAAPVFTSRQREVLRLLARGQSNADMSLELGVTLRTVRAHLAGVFAALGVDSRVKALVKARALGLDP